MARSYASLAVSRRVVVNLTTGSTIEGVLYDERGPLIVLRNASLHGDTGVAPMDGTVVIERDRIDFVQVLG